MINKKLDHNPDILSCIANLSSDEVFTHPKVANDILNLLPQKIWMNKKTRILDPFSKTGIFLRESVKRLNSGLNKDIKNKNNRIEHILQKQIYGISITELTSLVTRRSLYCSKKANNKYSIASNFKNEFGNIRYKETKHSWKNDKCHFCGANKSSYDRNRLDSHAYEFIHQKDPNHFFNMKFDVIIGNPPYQLNDGGGTGSSAIPIYQKFVEQAKKLNPRYLSMIIPSRWFSGGRGLDEFRNEMLNDKRIRVLHDFPNSNDCFAGVTIEGGVCYFLWDRDNPGDCKVYTHSKDKIISEATRPLLEKGSDTFIRYNPAVKILKKISKLNEKKFNDFMFANDPFGYDVREKGSYKRIKPNYKLKPFRNSVKFFYNGWNTKGVGYVEKDSISKNLNLVDKHKVFISKAYGMGGVPPYKVINTPFYGGSSSCCTETYLYIGPFKDKTTCENVISYMNTKLFRFLVLLKKNTQNAMKGVYDFIPLQNFANKIDDKLLYKKYQLDKDEIQFIDTLVL